MYNVLEGLPRRKLSPWELADLAARRKKTYSGLISPGSARSLRRAIENIVAIALPKTATDFKSGKDFKFKVNFITLTLPCPQSPYTDKEVKKTCLDNWLKAARRRFNLKSYVWRAERQVNGNIHFHLITDCYIQYDQLRDTWNDRLQLLKLIDTFEAKHGHRHPNSTDVHAVSKIRNLAAYMVKYMTKGHNTAESLRAQPPWREAERKIKMKRNGPKFQRVLSLAEQKINGRVWDCSENLKQKHKCDMVIDSTVSDWLTNAIDNLQCKYKANDRCSLVFLDGKKFDQVVTGTFRDQWEAWLNAMRN